MTKKRLLGVGLILLMCAAGWTVARSLTPEPDRESVKLPVLKVFSAKDGDALFRAYMVNWKGQDVIAWDTLVKSDYHEGDLAPVLVIRNKFPHGKEGPDLLSFEVTIEPRISR